jgi:Ribbon-helix-helix protein, copG family
VKNKHPNENGEIDARPLEELHRGGRHLDRERAEHDAFRRPDFRKVRRSRDTPISFKVHRETLEDLQALARAENSSMVQILERALALYKETMQGKR